MVNHPNRSKRAAHSLAFGRAVDAERLLTWLRDRLETDASEGSLVPRYVAAIGAMDTRDALHLLAYACLKGSVLPTLPRLD
jgi:hypothetical protein